MFVSALNVRVYRLNDDTWRFLPDPAMIRLRTLSLIDPPYWAKSPLQVSVYDVEPVNVPPRNTWSLTVPVLAPMLSTPV